MKLGDFTARDLPTEGGVFHRKEVERAATRSLERAAGGGERAGDTLHLEKFWPVYPFATDTATKRD